MSCAPALSKTRKRRFRKPAIQVKYRRRDKARGLGPFSLSWCGVAANSAGRFVALDFREQPHRKNHEKSEEGDDVLDTIVPKRVLMITSDGGYQDRNQRKAEFDFNGHRYFLRNKSMRCLPKPVLRSWRGLPAPIAGCRSAQQGLCCRRETAKAKLRTAREQTARQAPLRRSACSI